MLFQVNVTVFVVKKAEFAGEDSVGASGSWEAQTVKEFVAEVERNEGPANPCASTLQK